MSLADRPGPLAALAWQVFAMAAYAGTHLVTGGRIDRIDEGGARFLQAPTRSSSPPTTLAMATAASWP